MNKQLQQKIKALKSYFNQQPDVEMAFVFGSYAKGRETEDSDFDLAVYFTPQTRQVEWETETQYPQEDQIWGDAERIAGISTDLVVLNRAPASLADPIIQEGIPLVIKNRQSYLRFSEMVGGAAEDFRHFVSDYWKILQRSQSLHETDKTH